jgi:hypothetical protein
LLAPPLGAVILERTVANITSVIALTLMLLGFGAAALAAPAPSVEDNCAKFVESLKGEVTRDRKTGNVTGVNLAGTRVDDDDLIHLAPLKNLTTCDA